ncbi:MAG: ABC transporter permease [Candidatus Eremiobacter antarcticus]|nr:ABC transporter permease [Candidatus Eremiobacteraeota bacterium]MBC5808310.1 ABC transporter permease [Candidatus Eremiobacteraeota bacterium]PZR63680.1 MAG: ABC transporter permease [Candidatus Eremiobacter sp. RRmetagenome_bin22]
MQYLYHHTGQIWQLSAAHLALVSTALAIAFVVALPLALLVASKPAAAGPILGVLGAVYTIPSLALFALLIPVLGLGFWTAVIALAAYAQMILVRNFAAAINGVDRATVEAARGMGMQPWQIFWLVERPLAMPVALAGIRLATVSLIGIATIAAWINAGGLGTLVLDGIQHDYPQKAVAGAVAAVALALAADFGLRRIEATYSIRLERG